MKQPTYQRLLKRVVATQRLAERIKVEPRERKFQQEVVGTLDMAREELLNWHESYRRRRV